MSGEEYKLQGLNKLGGKKETQREHRSGPLNSDVPSTRTLSLQYPLLDHGSLDNFLELELKKSYESPAKRQERTSAVSGRGAITQTTQMIKIMNTHITVT
jgi:hypothetical protein